MDKKQLERFVDVVKSGSLSQTAKRLNISQPALSKSLRQLEDQLATRLLNRTPRGVHPTKFGDAFCRGRSSLHPSSDAPIKISKASEVPLLARWRWT
jgi:DNA-binding transcriptional LysR family regulator